MIELPDNVSPVSARPAIIDFGGDIEPFSGAAVTRVDRPGNRFAVAMSLPPLFGDDARLVVARLIRAKTEGLRVAFPLNNVDQGVPGAPLVDGAAQTGTTINIKDLTPYYQAKEGFWLSIVESSQHYLHNVSAATVADASGDIALPIFPMLRTSFSDEAVVHIYKPMIEGRVQGNEWEWEIALENNVGIEFLIREAG